MTYVECLEILRKSNGSMAKRLGWADEMYIYYVKSTLLKTVDNCTQFQIKKVMKMYKTMITVNDRFDLIDCKKGIIRLNKSYYLSQDVYANDWVVIFEDDIIKSEA